jgi:hypothetical protein
MKKLFIFLFALAVLTGCRDTEITTNIYDNQGVIKSQVIEKETLPTTLKVVNAEESVWCLSTSFFDFTTGSAAPYLKIGIFKIKYDSFPIKPGQPIAVVDEEYSSSWWNWSSVLNRTAERPALLRRTIIWIGEAPAATSTLKIRQGSGVGLIIDSEGIKIPGKTAVSFK